MFCLPDLARLFELEIVLPASQYPTTGASIDTRTLEPGEMFVALPGERADGHVFLEQAFRKGASGALISRAFYNQNRKDLEKQPELLHNLVVAQNPAAAFLEMAAWYRSRFQVRTIGITGSVGKTSTKEFTHYILKQKFPAIANAGNLNNTLGLPLTLFRLEPSHRYCVCEMGACRKGEIGELAKVLKPSWAVITRIAPVHLESFGNLETVYETKLEILDHLEKGGCAVLPDDDHVLLEKARRYSREIVKCGESPDADYRLSHIKVQGSEVRFQLNGHPFSFPGIAPFLARNAALGIAAADRSGFPIDEIPSVWNDLKLPAGRFERRVLQNGIRIIFDGYNANPFAFRHALETFRNVPSEGRKILVFSDMLELGSEEVLFHEQLGQTIAGFQMDGIFAYGRLSRHALDQITKTKGNSGEARFFESREELGNYLKKYLKSGDTLLLKASRGMRIEKIIEELEFTGTAH